MSSLQTPVLAVRQPWAGLIAAGLKTSFPCDNSIEFLYQESNHWAPLSYHKEGKTHFWGLKDIQALKNPVSFKMPRGAVVWTSAELENL